MYDKHGVHIPTHGDVTCVESVIGAEKTRLAQCSNTEESYNSKMSFAFPACQRMRRLGPSTLSHDPP